jgi:hypothetical protein
VRANLDKKGMAIFYAALIGVAVIVPVITYLFVTDYAQYTTHKTSDNIEIMEGLHMSITSVNRQPEVSGVTTGIPELIGGFQKVAASSGNIFIVVRLNFTNADQVAAVPSSSDIFLETSGKRIHASDSVQTIMKKKVRTVAGEQDRNVLCNSYPDFIASDSSEDTCLIFEVDDGDEPLSLFYREGGSVKLIVDLRQ